MTGFDTVNDLKFKTTRDALGYIVFGGGKYLGIFYLSSCFDYTNLSWEWSRALRLSYVFPSSVFEKIQMELLEPSGNAISSFGVFGGWWS